MLVSKKAKDINLLPESEASKGASKIVPAIAVFAVIILIAALVAVVVTFMRISATNQNKDLQDSLVIKNQEWQKVASSAASISQVKAKLTAYQTYNQQFPALVDYISKLKSQLPSPASLESLNLDNKGRASLQVEMVSPADAYQLVNLLNENDNFSAVKLISISKSSEAGQYLINLTLAIKK